MAQRNSGKSRKYLADFDNSLVESRRPSDFNGAISPSTYRLSPPAVVSNALRFYSFILSLRNFT